MTMGERPHGRPPSYPIVVTTTTSSNTNSSSSGSRGAVISSNRADDVGGGGSTDMNTMNTPTPDNNNNNNNNNSSTNNNANPNVTNEPPPPHPIQSLQSAHHLYQREKDPVASLRECRRIWGREDATVDAIENANNDAVGDVATDDNNNNAAKTAPLSQRHNEAVLSHLSFLRSRRRRPRPASFDQVSEKKDVLRNTINAKHVSDTLKNGGEEAGGGGENLAELLSTMLEISPSVVIGKDATSKIISDAGINNTFGTAKQKEKETKNNTKKKKQQHQQQHSSPLFRFNQLVGMYNLCLTHYASGNYQMAISSCANNDSDGILIPFCKEMKIISQCNHDYDDGDYGDCEGNVVGGGGSGGGGGVGNDKSGNQSNDSGSNNNSSSSNGRNSNINSNNTDGNHTDNNHANGNNGDDSFARNLVMTTRMAFLVLDCLLALHAGNGLGLAPLLISLNDDNGDDGDDGDDNANDGKRTTFQNDEKFTLSAKDILSWIEKNALSNAKSKKHCTTMTENDLGYNELKFKLHLYRSRMLFLGTTMESDKHKLETEGEDVATRARLSRKELKSAMDIYQNKLCIDEDEGKEHHVGGGGGSEVHSQYGGGKSGGGSTTCNGGKASSSTHRNNSMGKHHNQDGSETTSVTSIAGGSMATSMSDAIWNDGKGSAVAGATFEGMPNKMISNVHHHQHPPQQASQQSSVSAPMKKKDNPDLDVRHKLTLYLKANLEYVRGNTTKSLKLCSEARLAGRKNRMDGRNEEKSRRDGSRSNGISEPTENGVVHQSTDKSNGFESSCDFPNVNATTISDVESLMASDYDEAIYYNNLALVHQTAGKVHVALHYYAHALSYMERVRKLDENASTHLLGNNANFWSDGVSRPDISAEILNNTSLCAFQANDFKSAYECMARCISISSDVFGKRARSWLRMAQSCIGIHSNIKKTQHVLRSNFGVIEYCDAASPTVVIGMSNSSGKIEMTSLASNIASEEDFREVSTNPLPRASFCLYRALYLSNSNLAQNAGEPDAQSSTIEQSCNIDGDGFESALLSLAYVKLELMDPIGALEMCKLILGSIFFPQCDVDGQDSHTVLSRRRHAIARLYLCEALCLLGDANDAINVLFGDRHDNDETLQRLAEDFAMDATSKATKYDKKQVNSSLPSRIDDARDIVHATASGLFSSLENVEKAKQYASHVKNTNVMEESRLNYSSFERQVLLYCLLKENDTEGAVALLHSG